MQVSLPVNRVVPPLPLANFLLLCRGLICPFGDPGSSIMDVFSFHTFCLAGCSFSQGLKNLLHALDQISAAQTCLSSLDPWAPNLAPSFIWGFLHMLLPLFGMFPPLTSSAHPSAHLLLQVSCSNSRPLLDSSPISPLSTLLTPH